MMGVFIALAVSMATDPEEPKNWRLPSLWGLFVAAVCYLLCAWLAHFLSAAKPAVTISREGIRFCNGKFAAWTNIAEKHLAFTEH